MHAPPPLRIAEISSVGGVEECRISGTNPLRTWGWLFKAGLVYPKIQPYNCLHVSQQIFNIYTVSISKLRF